MGGFRPVSRQVSVRRILPISGVASNADLQANISLPSPLWSIFQVLSTSEDGERLGLVQSVWIRLYLPLRTIPRRSGS
jgi:hypothetical protein